MLGAVQAAIRSAPAALGIDVTIGAVYTMKDRDKIPDDATRRPWIRATIMHNDAGRGSISGRRRTHEGTFRVSVFWPNDKSDSANKVQVLANYIQQCLVAHRGFVWLKRIRFEDVEPEGAYSREDVVCDFTWEQLSGVVSAAEGSTPTPTPPSTPPIEDIIDATVLGTDEQDQYIDFGSGSDVLLLNLGE
jgi:hypothetical protein